MANTTIDKEDNSIAAVVHQGKSVADWEKLFKDTYNFSQQQILAMIRDGQDLGRLLQGLDESAAQKNIDDPIFKGEQFFFNENEENAAAPSRIEFVTYDSKTGNEVSRSQIDPKDTTWITLEYLSNVMDDFNDAAKYGLKNGIGGQTAIIFIDGQPVSTISSVRKAQLRRFFDSLDESVEDEEAALNESAREPEDVVTVEDFIELLQRRAQLDDKIVFRGNKREMLLKDVISKGQTALVDLAEGRSSKLFETETGTEDGINTVADLIDALNDVVDSPNSTTIVIKDSNGNPCEIDSVNLDRRGTTLVISASGIGMNEGKSWRNGGYGGTGRSYSSLGGKAPRGASIGWYAIDQLDPKANGKMPGWRCGPSNFPFVDLLYPERKYKIGTMVMRNKYVKAGSMSGEKYIAIPSYFSAIKDNDEEAINLLNALGIPLDLTFGMDPNDDYSMTYMNESSMGLDSPNYEKTVADMLSDLYQISDKWGDDLLVKIVDPVSRQEKDPQLTINSKGGRKIVAIN